MKDPLKKPTLLSLYASPQTPKHCAVQYCRVARYGLAQNWNPLKVHRCYTSSNFATDERKIHKQSKRCQRAWTPLFPVRPADVPGVTPPLFTFQGIGRDFLQVGRFSLAVTVRCRGEGERWKWHECLLIQAARGMLETTRMGLTVFHLKKKKSKSSPMTDGT